MLRISVSIENVERPASSLSVAFLILAGITPGSNYSIVRDTPNDDHFYLYLPTVSDFKKAQDVSSLLLAANPNNKHWSEAARHCVKQRAIIRTPETGCILHFIVYETISNSQPVQNETSARGDGDKELGIWEQYAKETSSESTTTVLKRLGVDGLGTVRVGQAKVSIYDVVKSLGPHGACGNETSTLQAPLLDFSDTPNERGLVKLTIKPVQELSWNGHPLSDVNAILSEMCSEDKWKHLVSRPPAYNLETYLANAKRAKQVVIHDYVNHYIRMFPPIPGTKEGITENGFDSAVAATLAFHSQGDGNVRVGGRLRAAIPRIVTTHAPVTYIDGDFPVPMPFYYLNPADPAFINEHYHYKYLKSILDNLCYHFGFSSELLARTLHEHLDQQGNLTHCSADVLACLRIFGLFLTHLNTTFRYRADVAIGRGSNGENAVKIREDTSRDLDMGLDSEDCDGMDHATHTIMYIVRCGISGVHNEHLENDRLLKILKRTIVKAPLSVGGWPDAGLNAFQRLLFYYTPMSLMGLATAAFPNDKTSADGMPQVHVKDMDNLKQEDAGEVRKMYLRTGEHPDMIAHSWSIIMPIQTIVDALVESIKHEDEGGTRRASQDQATVDALLELHATLETEVLPLPLLPPMTLEGTGPTNPFCVVGASAWCDPASRDRLRAIEAKNRNLNIYNKNGDTSSGATIEDGTWYERGVIHCEEGQLQWLPGDDLERRASILYKMVTIAHLPFFDELLGVEDFTCAFISSDGEEFGVDIEHVLGPKDSHFGLALPVHRIPMHIRKEANEFGWQVRHWRLPTQLGAYSVGNIKLPTPVEQSGKFDPLQVFARNMVIVNKKVISSQHLLEFERQLRERGTDIRQTDEKLQPYGPPITVYTYVPK